MPFYGNTHTTTSVTSLQTTLFRHEARDIFRNATNAAEEDAVIFTGSGTTAAVHKLINAMSLHEVCLSLIYRFGIEQMVTIITVKTSRKYSPAPPNSSAMYIQLKLNFRINLE